MPACIQIKKNVDVGWLVDEGQKEHKSAVDNVVLIDLVSRFSVQIA